MEAKEIVIHIKICCGVTWSWNGVVFVLLRHVSVLT